MTSYKKVWWISLFIKLLIAAAVPLSADEAYYWVWSHFPQLSYFDHPPFVAWLYKVGSIFPDQIVRWPGVTLFHLGFLFWFQFLKTKLNDSEILGWFILCLLCPLLGLGSILVLPDGPLFFFFSASLYFFFKAFKNPKFYFFAAFGASLGLGFLSKYLIVIPAFLLALCTFNHRKEADIKIKDLLTIVLFGFLLSSPVLIWNWENGFKSFLFQLQHGLAEGSWHWKWTADYIMGTLLLMFPMNLFWSHKAPKNSFNSVFLFLALGGFSFFLLSSFKGSVELNWPSIFYPCLFVLSIQVASKKNVLKNSIYWLCVYSLAAVTMLMGLAPGLVYKIKEPINIAALSKLPTEAAPLYASTYQMASLLWWNSHKPVFKLSGSSRYDFFDEQAASLPTSSIFYLIKQPGNNLPDWLQSSAWSVQEMQKPDEAHILLKVMKKDPL